MILLIHPPVAKPCEPPAGIARLSAALAGAGIGHRLFDANIEGLLDRLRLPGPPGGNGEDPWTRRAYRNRERNISALRDPELYRNMDRYKQVVSDLGRVLTIGSPSGSVVGMANFEAQGHSPLRSTDLLEAARRPERNPFHAFFQERLEALFREGEPSVVGISVNTLSQALCAFAMVGLIRRLLPGVKVVLGGGLVTSWLKNGSPADRFSGLVDHFVAGPGEHRLLSLLGAETEGTTVPRPDYGRLPRRSYLAPGFILPYSASTGCYWARCSFCPEKSAGNRHRPLSPGQVVSDLRVLTETTGPALVHLLDNAVSPSHLEALAAEPVGAPWYGFARVSRRLGDPDFCRALKRSGCVMLQLGVESGDQVVLDALEKGTTVAMASSALVNLKKAGIATYVYLLFGTPSETEGSARKTLAFTAEHCESIDFLNLALFNMPIGSPTEPGIETRTFYEGDLSLYTGFTHPDGWNRREVRFFLDRTFKRHSAVSAILKRDPPVFTSNHAPFCNIV